MNRPSDDERSAISVAYAWASTIIVIAAEMVVPGLIGFGIGRGLGAGAMIVFALIGFAGGMTLAIVHLVRLTKTKDKSKL
jgi:hypothetical protein